MRKLIPIFNVSTSYQFKAPQLKILGGAPEEYRGERWATGDYSGRI